MNKMASMMLVLALPLGCATQPPQAAVPAPSAQLDQPRAETRVTAVEVAGAATMGALRGAGVCAIPAIIGTIAAGPVGLYLGGSIFLVCLPVGVLLGAVAGAANAATREPPINRPMMQPYPPEFLYLGPFDGINEMPAGQLHIATHTTREIGSPGKKGAWLIVDFEEPTKDGELSYMTDVIVACETGALTFAAWATNNRPKAQGTSIITHVLPSSLLVDKPTGALLQAGQEICTRPSAFICASGGACHPAH